MSKRESKSDGATCILQGAEAISQASNAARAFGTLEGGDEDELARLCIVVEELVANLYDHGGLSENDKVELRLASEASGIRVTIIDPGAPFDPWKASQTGQPTERGAGAGIDIIKAWARFVGYRATPEGNQLELLLPLRRKGCPT